MGRAYLTIIGILLCVSLSYAEITVGINPIFMDQTLTNPKLYIPITNRGTGAELNVGFFSNKVSMRGYHLFTIKSSSATSILEDAKTSVTKPAELVSTFTATRFEIGMPYINNGTIIEPFFVNSYTKLDTNINIDSLNTSDSINNNTSGLGLFYGQKIVNRQAVYLKGAITPKDKIFDGSYNVVFKNCSFGAGYTYREYENIKITGPMLLLQIAF